jgi:hypothetical protein
MADPLLGIPEGLYPDLDAAMNAVATRLGGACEKWVP